MGVYIPNAVPPEECQRCRFIELMNGQWKLQCWLNLKPIPSEGKRDDCPLIEIGDIQYKAFLEFNEKLMKKIEEHFLYGERRTDE